MCRMRSLALCIVLALTMGVPAFGAGFFEVLYASSVRQEEDLDGLDDALAGGFTFGYEADLVASGVMIDVELGYEVSDQEVKSLDDSDLFYRNHRGFVGVRVKYAGYGYVRPYVGFGVMAYAYYEASKDLEDPPHDSLDFEIESNFSGTYTVLGIDFFFAERGSLGLGIEQRVFKYEVKDTDDGDIDLDAEVKRTALKFIVLF